MLIKNGAALEISIWGSGIKLGKRHFNEPPQVVLTQLSTTLFLSGPPCPSFQLSKLSKAELLKDAQNTMGGRQPESEVLFSNGMGWYLCTRR